MRKQMSFYTGRACSEFFFCFLAEKCQDLSMLLLAKGALLSQILSLGWDIYGSFSFWLLPISC